MISNAGPNDAGRYDVVLASTDNLPVEVASGAPRSGAILEYLEAEEEGDEQVLIFDVNPPAGLSQVGARR